MYYLLYIWNCGAKNYPENFSLWEIPSRYVNSTINKISKAQILRLELFSSGKKYSLSQ